MKTLENSTRMQPLSVKDQISIHISPDEIGQRVDKLLTTKLPAYSRSFFQTLIEQSLISLDDHIITKPSTIIKQPATITVNFPAAPQRPTAEQMTSFDLGIEILYTHEHFFIVYKPASILVHPAENDTYSPTLVDWLLCHYHELKSVGDWQRPGIVHRLDKDTSGLLVIPRTNYAHMAFGEMFKKRTIKKTYYAVVKGTPSAQGSIDFAIGRNPIHRKKMTTYAKQNDFSPATTDKNSRGRQDRTARQSLTHYKVKEYFKDSTFVEVHPVTGRTHQIRVHFSAIGHSLIGDQLYGSSSKLISRQALHAFSLSFDFQGKTFYFEKEIPEDFKKLLEQLRTTK